MATKAKKNPAAQALGRLGGSANSKAQNAARAKNAQKAGRPQRVCSHCAQPVKGGHVDRALDESCGAHGWRWERAGARHPAPVSVALQLVREAHELLSNLTEADLDSNPPSKVDLRDWLREAARLVGKRGKQAKSAPASEPLAAAVGQ